MRWETKASIGIVLPKIFPEAKKNEETYIKCLEKLLIDPFFTVIEVSYIGNEKLLNRVKTIAIESGVELLFNGGDAFRELEIDLSSLEEDIRRSSIEKVKELVNQSYFLNAKILHIVTGKYDDEEKKNEMIESFIRSSKEICQYAKENRTTYELTISLENGDRYLDRKYLLGPTNEAVYVVQRVWEEYDNFGLLLDQSHLPVMEEDFTKSLWRAKDMLTHVHLGNSLVKDQNSKLFGDKHLPFNVPGSEVGVEELTDFLVTLNDIDFYKSPKPTKKPTLSFEVGGLKDQNIDLVIANIKRVFFEAWYRAEEMSCKY